MRRAAAFAVASLLSSAALANWTASGRFVYEDREWNESGFSGTILTKPIRFADVEVIDPTKSGSKQILAKGKTDADGYYAIPVVDSTTRTKVRVRVLTRSNYTSDLFVRVTNQGGSIYVGQSADVTSHAPNVNVDWGTLTALAFAGGEAFNLFDMGVYGADYIKAMTGARPNSTKLVTIKWQSNGGVTVSQTSGNTVTIRDTGGYDDTVALHEWGHYAMTNYSKSSNPAGSHALADCHQDLRLAFDEGRATYLGNSVVRMFDLGPANVYVRTSGASGPGGALNFFDLESETQYSCDGSGSEVTVARSLWDITDGPSTNDYTPGTDETLDALALPDVESWQTFASSVFKGATNVTHETFWNSWFDSTVANGNLQAMKDIFGALGIEYFPDAFESNDTTGTATLLYANGGLVHLTYFADTDGDGKGAADTDLFAFDAVGGAVYTAQTLNTYSDANTNLEILDTNGSTVLASNNDRSASDHTSLVTWTAPRSDRFYIRSKHATDYGIHGSYDLSLTTP
ncbi:MAG TPA: hypothetical protein VF139_06860 [Candidatus Polarisedimenticolaceae bacterium]